MSKVITLDGLKTGSLDRKHRGGCEKTMRMYSPTVDREVDVCTDAAQRHAESPMGLKRKPGRPKGSTVKRGAKKPRVKSCKTPKWIRGKKGRKVCRCADSGNTQILKNSVCRLVDN